MPVYDPGQSAPPDSAPNPKRDEVPLALFKRPRTDAPAAASDADAGFRDGVRPVPDEAVARPTTIRKEGPSPMALKPNFPATGIPPQPSHPAVPSAGPLARPAPAGKPQAGDRRALVVGRGIALAGGAISDCERLEVHGTVEVSIRHALELIIADSGVFRGEAEIEEADISGAFDGSVTATSRLVVRSTGKVTGTIRCQRLMVEEGAQVSGKIEMISGPTATAASPRAAAAPAPEAPAAPPVPPEPVYARG
jgi:cytoskeletal protein CcmA (bactofilin family)